MPEFTQDWFSHNVQGLNAVLAKLEARKNFLEIGCFEGLSTCWFLKHWLSDDGTICSIDTFEGGIEHGKIEYSGIRERFEANVAEMKGPGQRVELIQDSSHRALARLLSEERQFDFIYVDGSHEAPNVMVDACQAYHLLTIGGLMVFDDYLWGPQKPILHTPKVAVDMFTLLFRERVSILLMNYQLTIQKTA